MTRIGSSTNHADQALLESQTTGPDLCQTVQIAAVCEIALQVDATTIIEHDRNWRET